MSEMLPGPRLLPLVDAPPPERRDAARNRELLLEAARRLVHQHGAPGVTMDAVAAAAGVGKGTVFRRFESREGLMAAVLNYSESEWQGAVMSGPAPLGPGAEPWERLLAFGRSRLETTLVHAELIRAAGRAGGSRSFAAYSFATRHVHYLLHELGVTGDLPLLAVALLAPLEALILDQQVTVEGFPLERVYAGWVDLARRIVGVRT
ncbi:TetR/AcrR family transcriptional regulator [Nocardioides sp. URHA0020]|uniref:TetR/AcrR family transcriptional regulator n=1 Tax=Nocardioides sp. URHA0020 TaxID=1380392 RepID=UPI000A95D9D2|nr:TetR/AcrR family transcriptional regulator [Nocardioides sp. URHA0020]